jgi:hypothetical protein
MEFVILIAIIGSLLLQCLCLAKLENDLKKNSNNIENMIDKLKEDGKV